ncbi:MAG: TonB-dependent receptor [Acidibrevibacterium sp.]|jgi:iron complex outermembrane receptor protein|uniref:TonB-dependent receptor n=1 Tax=Acidibrevibacterium fodinaquatile TaxID=1969806 RepID=UPI0023A8F259|nr:TonB-dependent receptor [Acidibrevibacterium fodinaquatile]MCA7121141.1 TonB-dependent receptor [Acidibrevibacterium fodinaquatile]
MHVTRALARRAPSVLLMASTLLAGHAALAQVVTGTISSGGGNAAPLPLVSDNDTQLAQNASGVGGIVNAGSVNAAGGGGTSAAPVPGATVPPTQQQLFESGQTTRVLDQQQLQSVGPMGGGAQAIGLAPGAQVVGYGNTGSTKYNVSLDGLANGWGGFGGQTGNNNLMMTFDGVPMNNVATGLWASATVPQIGMIQNIDVGYGPGDAKDRWYDTTGGTIEFTPIQPTAKAGADIVASYGSYDTVNLNFDIRTGNIGGWSTVIAGGIGEGNDFRTSQNGFDSPAENYAFYVKTVKNFSDGDVSFGGYIAQGGGYRPNVIPVSPMAGVSVNGAGAAGPLYNEKANMFAALDPQVWAKFDQNQFATVYAKQNIHVDDYTTFHNMAWYSDEKRLHSDFNNFQPDYNQLYEMNTPDNWTLGDKMWFTTTLPYNTVDYGAYYIYGLYQTVNSFWSPDAPYYGSQYAPNGNYRFGNFYSGDAAIFLQDDIHPFSQLHITPSIRFVDDTLQYANGAGQYGAFPNATGNDQGQFGSQHASWTGVEPGVNVNYQALKWLALYGNYEESYQTPSVGGGGGYFQAFPVTVATEPKLELAQYWQIGAKAKFNDPDYYVKNFLLDVNYFDLRLADQTANVALNVNGTEVTTTGTSEYKGVNIAMDDNPFSTVHTFFNGAIMNALYTSYDVIGGSNFNGSHVPYVPDTTLNLGVDYTYFVGDTAVKPSFWWQFTGPQYYFNNITAAPTNTTMGAYQTLNASIDVKKPFSVAGFGKTLDVSFTILNFTNNRFNIYEYLDSAGDYFGPSAASGILGLPGAPMTMYGQVALSF